jgi:hypothetical protein
MTESLAKCAVREFVEEAISTVLARNLPLDEMRGVALFNPERDYVLTQLACFDVARQAIADIPNFLGRFGTDAGTRIALQFAYQYFRRVNSVKYEEAVFESLWCDFIAEIEDAYWIVRGVANVRNFHSGENLIELGDGITIRGRSNTELASFGFGSAVWERMADDWRSGFGHSQFVLLVEDSFEKQPDNLVLLDSARVWTKAVRAIQALRLAGAGSISIGPMWIVRFARFNVGMGGLTSIGASIPATSGPVYNWTDGEPRIYESIYRALEKLEQGGKGRSPGNVMLALRAFMGAYDRWPVDSGAQLLDNITALEALLGTDTEISFKLSFRVAALLATTDNERGLLFKLMKDFYDTRSKLVHGAPFKEKHRLLLGREEELRSIVRQLLRSFVEYAVAPSGVYSSSFWRDGLDVALMDASEREKIRAALKLVSMKGGQNS